VVTSGIGTPSLEIVVGELAALNEIDFQTRTRKSDFPRLHIIRVGSSGGLQAATQLGTPIITTYAIGLDNTGLYYEAPYPDQNCQRLEAELAQVFKNNMSAQSRFYGKLRPYVTRAAPAIVEALIQAGERLGVPAKSGLTVSCPGFFAPEGRDVSRLRPSVPDLDKIFTDFDPRIGDQRVENMEMEASFLIHFMGGLGYWAGTICPAIANRQKDTFAVDYQAAIENATQMALLALATLRKR
jgi:uridine phosphorylase